MFARLPDPAPLDRGDHGDRGDRGDRSVDDDRGASDDRGRRDRVSLTVDGKPVAAHRGDSVAAALLAAGVEAFRTTPVSGAARGPWCLMGVCYDCLVVINGRPNRQSCMVEVGEGMQVETQHGARAIGSGDPVDGPHR